MGAMGTGVLLGFIAAQSIAGAVTWPLRARIGGSSTAQHRELSVPSDFPREAGIGAISAARIRQDEHSCSPEGRALEAWSGFVHVRQHDRQQRQTQQPDRLRMPASDLHCQAARSSAQLTGSQFGGRFSRSIDEADEPKPVLRQAERFLGAIQAWRETRLVEQAPKQIRRRCEGMAALRRSSRRIDRDEEDREVGHDDVLEASHPPIQLTARARRTDLSVCT